MVNFDIGQFILYMVALVFSVSLHEAAHAWMSNRFGDDLARLQGRISLNPAVHVDPIGTILFPAIAFFTHAPVLGWARPTPVNPLKWRNKRVANFWVSLAGIIVNSIIALAAGITMRLLYSSGVLDERLLPAGTDSAIAVGAVKLLWVLFQLNVVLAVFNLIPIPPLDGSKVLSSLVPSLEPAFDSIERFGFLLLFVVMFTGVFNGLFVFVMRLAVNIIFIGAS